jgi:hypothetical protein
MTLASWREDLKGQRHELRVCGRARSGTTPDDQLHDRRSHLVGRGRGLWVVQVSRTVRGCSGTCAHRGAGIGGNQIDAQPSGDGFSVVFVQTVEGEALVEQSRSLEEHLTSISRSTSGRARAAASAVARN